MYIFFIMLLCILLYIVRVIMGPSVWDRLLGLNLIVSKVIMVAILLASFYDLPYMLDFAVLYTILGFIGTIFVSLYLADRIQKGRK